VIIYSGYSISRMPLSSRIDVLLENHPDRTSMPCSLDNRRLTRSGRHELNSTSSYCSILPNTAILRSNKTSHFNVRKGCLANYHIHSDLLQCPSQLYYSPPGHTSQFLFSFLHNSPVFSTNHHHRSHQSNQPQLNTKSQCKSPPFPPQSNLTTTATNQTWPQKKITQPPLPPQPQAPPSTTISNSL